MTNKYSNLDLKQLLALSNSHIETVNIWTNYITENKVISDDLLTTIKAVIAIHENEIKEIEAFLFGGLIND